MTRKQQSSTRPGWPQPERLVLVTMWLVTTIVYVVMIWGGVRQTGGFYTERQLLQALYVAALLWYLVRSGPPLSRLAEMEPPAFLQKKAVRWIPALVIGLLFALTALTDFGFGLLLVLMMVALGPILIVWRRGIRLVPALQGIGLALIALLAGLPMLMVGFVSGAGYLFTLMVVPMYIAGALLLARTNLGEVQSLGQHYPTAVRNFMRGCLLFLPLGLANAAAGSPGGLSFYWVSEWWMPFTMPLWSGIVEETWYRLFLVGLVYFLLYPALQKRPAIAALLAVLFSGITFGLGHGRTWDHFLTTGLLFGVPLAFTFARRDWEHAVGAHYMVNMIPWVVVFLGI